MFVRVRGKGACPENSQAAVMHLRGFRHTHSGAPPDSVFPLITTSVTVAGDPPQLHEGASPTSPSPSAALLPITMRPFRFPVFSVGIHAAALAKAQTKCMVTLSQPADSTTATETSSPTSPLSFLDSEVARMVWRETWNVYDILYDEVPLLPWMEAEKSSAAAIALAETVEAELRCLAESDAKVHLDSLESLKAKTDGFELASSLTGNHQVIVCPHYYASEALPAATFTKVLMDAHPTAIASDGPVVVLDVRDLSVALAGAKAMVNIAWYTAFAAMQPDSALLRCRAVVVRLPYAVVPTYAQALENSTATTGSAPTIADAFVETVDFIGEHITAVRHAMVRELGNASAALARSWAQAPPVVVLGGAPESMSACLRALMERSASPAEVVVFHGDHLSPGSDSAGLDQAHAHERSAHKMAEYQSIGVACGRAVTVETVLVPLKALLEGGEEPWDAYTLRERQRLNFCPCCGDCGNEGSSDGADHAHAHGHHR